MVPRVSLQSGGCRGFGRGLGAWAALGEWGREWQGKRSALDS
jgi:hypothetical protein